MEDLVSIIVPVYNGEFNVARTLESLIAQSYKNIEIIVVNDGSLDQTKLIVENYKNEDTRIKIHNQENLGVSVARNEGMKLANGKYLCFLDSGDTYEKEFVEKMLVKIIETDSDFVYCGYNRVVNGKKKRQIISFTKRKLQINYLLNRTHPSVSSWLIKKNYLVRYSIEFPPGIQFSEDVEFYTKVTAHSTKYSYVSEYLSNYILDEQEESLSSFSIDKIDKDFESMNRIAQRKSMQNHEIQRAIFDYRLNALISFRLYEAIQRNESIEIIQEYYEKYASIIKKFSFSNGLRSLKLNFIKMKIIRKMRVY